MRHLLACLLLLGSPLGAQSVGPCDWQAAAQALVEPWEENTRLFANGEVRLAALDTIELAIAAAYLLVLSPPRAELGERQCKVVGFTDQMGFTAIHFGDLSAGYDPAKGLLFDVPVRIGDAETGFANSAMLSLTLNQATGAITTALELGRE